MSQEELDFLAPAEGPDELGRLGAYRVLKQLGKGGMGMVFQAEDPQLKRSIALKVMLPQYAQNASARERFLREARAAAAIEHDNIIPIHQVGEDRGVPFIAMPFLKGASLEDYLKKKSLTMAQICRIGRETARGLAAAHEKGLVHRDIKPANLWLDATAQGRTKILDFGLARPTQDDTNLTQDGAIVGTPSYMAPEQASGGAVDARTDLFSLGAVLYLLCTGQKPFPGSSTLQILNALATTNPKPVRELNPDTPVALADLVMKLLEKDPAKRPASAKAVVDAIVNVEREMQRGGDAGASGLPPSALNASGSMTKIVSPRAATETLVAPTDDVPKKKRAVAAKKKAGVPTWVWLAGGGAAAALLLLVTILLLTRGDKQATVAIASEEPGVEVVFDGEKGQVKVSVPVAHSFKLQPGAWKARLERPAPHLKVEPAEFEAVAGQTLKVNVTRVAVPPQPPVVIAGKEPPLAVAPFDAKKALEYQQLWAKHLGRQVEETNSIGMKLRLIPPGEFLMGLPQNEIDSLIKAIPQSESAHRKMGPQHTVVLTRPLFMGHSEVTVEQFRAFVQVAGYKTEPERNGKGAHVWDKDRKNWTPDAKANWQNPGWPIEGDFPVSGITWNDAVAFCEWLSRKEGRRYRLPTEAEWEHACRAGTTTPTPYGATVGPKQAIFGATSAGRPAKVGQLEANAFGLRDMAGNVWEYCADYLDDYPAGRQVDPKGPNTGKTRVARGYGYDGHSNYMFSAQRVHRSQDEAMVVQGFRVVCEVEPAGGLDPRAGAWQPIFNGTEVPGSVGYNPDNLDFKQAFTVVTEDGRPAVKCVASKSIGMNLHPGLPSYHLRIHFKWAKEGAIGIFEIPYLRKLRPESSYQTFRLYQNGNLYYSPTRLVDEGAIKGGKIVVRTASSEGGRSLLSNKNLLKPQGEWNQADLIVLGDACIQLVNREIAVIGCNIRHKDAKGNDVPVINGDISLTCQGTTPVYFRDLEIRAIGSIPPEVLDKAAWKSLFNGKDLKGFGTDAKSAGVAEIVSDDGQPAIRLSGHKWLNIGPLGNYHLRFEYKMEDGAGGGVHHFQRNGFDLTLRPAFVKSAASAISSTGNTPWTYQRAAVRGGKLESLGKTLPVGTWVKLGAVPPSPNAPWQRVEILRLDDSFVYLANGNVVAALTNLRNASGEKDTGKTIITFWSDGGGPAHLRNLEIRDIGALPPDLER